MTLPDVTLDQVGGFVRLKTWIAQRQALFQNAALAPGLLQTRPLSVIRAEDFERLRTWAHQRCVMVD